MTAPAAPVLVMGEALVDLVPEDTAGPTGYVAHPGGAPANLAAGLARLGVRVGFAGGLGRDAFGAAIERRLTAAGVDLGLCTRSDRPTALAVADPPPGGTSRAVGPRGTTAGDAPSEDGTAYDFHLADTATFRIAPQTRGLDGFGAVCVGGLAAVVAPAAGAVAETAAAAASRTLLAVDPNVRTLPALDQHDCRERLTALCEQAHIVKASDEDVRQLWPGETAEFTCRRLAAGGRLVVLTRGAAGSTAFTPRGDRVDVPATPVPVVNTIGAGDAFTAGVLTWLARAGLLRPGGPADITAGQVRDMLALGAEVAASVCAQAGSEPAGLGLVTTGSG
ncbi:PfkB family carbohydrate kinase [Streptomyces sp. 8N616]|uniref:PfkB family carbohydrate kinase n=1 Tax=Streptomyces sp. 8N616 TaxID=3457414 RepID=UPI003FD636D8